jgi:hypothetical protein
MLHRGSIVAVNVALALCLVASQVSAEVFTYPKKGQSQQQFEQDQLRAISGRKADGVRPNPTQQSAAAPPQRVGPYAARPRGPPSAPWWRHWRRCREGRRCGAGVGATVALVRQGRQNQQAAQAQQQAQAQAQAGYSNYDRAYAGCMAGRGYQVS